MQCTYVINGDSQCKLRTTTDSGYCHKHKHKIMPNHKFPKPKTCPICFGSMHQCHRPLLCSHWVHRKCIQKSGKAECPLCRQKLDTDVDIDISKNFATLEVAQQQYPVIEIPQGAIVLAVIVYQLYAFIISPHDRTLGLDHFVNCAINGMVPLEHPNHENIYAIVYGEALGMYFNAQYWG